MAEKWKPQPPMVYQQWVDTIKKEAKLTNWESDFVHGISRQLVLREALTQYQAEKLEQIYVDKTS